ncbi:MAG: hypothetical protein ACR2NG_06365 [Acidimicrobiia bacterium]
MNTELLLRVKRSDPAPPHVGTPHEIWDSHRVLGELQRRIDDGAASRPRRGQATRRGWMVAAIVAAVTVVALGTLALLARSDGSAPPAETPTTITEPPPTTEAAVTSDTVGATTTTLAAAPVVPPGGGPTLEFVRVESPFEGELGSGTWFKGALYALPDVEGELRRSVDGFAWESVPGLPKATNVRHRMLQSDADRLVLVTMPEDGGSILVNTSQNGSDWTSSAIETPALDGSNMAGEFGWDEDFYYSDNFAIGPKGILVTATLSLSFEGESFANGLVAPDEGIHVEVVDLDLDREVMIVRFLDEANGMEQIGDLREFDLGALGFSGAFSNLIDVMNAHPIWKSQVDGFLAQLTSEAQSGFALASVGYAWLSQDGTTWSPVSRSGPLDGGEFSGVLATADGFVATAANPYRTDELPPDVRYLADGFDGTIVWESDDGTTWVEAEGLMSQHANQPSRLLQWDGEIVEHVGVGTVRSTIDDTEVRTLASPQELVFPDVPTAGLRLSINDFGLFGSPSYGWWGPDATELLFSADGTTWNRWEPTEFAIGGSRDEGGEHSGDAWVVGTGDDFVVVQRLDPDAAGDASYSLWVGRAQDQ